ncbi:MAG: hypothetical protein OHK0023_01020 [Anaerolineae bacterium]
MSSPVKHSLFHQYAVWLTLALTASQRLHEKDISPLAAFNSAAHWLLKPSMLLLPLALITRRWRLASALAYPFSLFVREYGPTLWRSANYTPTKPPAGSFSLLTFNIHKESDNLAPIFNVIRDAKADIVALQELGEEACAAIARDLCDEYPFQALHPYAPFPSAGQGVLSKFPIHADRYWRHEDVHQALGHQRVVLEIHGRQAALYNLHPVHPGMVGRIFDARPRHMELDRLLAQIAQDALPVFMAGDFNLTDQSDAYRHITAAYRDAYREAGRSFMGYTFPDWRYPQSHLFNQDLPLGVVPLLARLDYVFLGRAFAAVDVEVMPDSGGSDHRPVKAILRWQDSA